MHGCDEAIVLSGGGERKAILHRRYGTANICPATTNCPFPNGAIPNARSSPPLPITGEIDDAPAGSQHGDEAVEGATLRVLDRLHRGEIGGGRESRNQDAPFLAEEQVGDRIRAAATQITRLHNLASVVGHHANKAVVLSSELSLRRFRGHRKARRPGVSRE